MDEEFTFNEEYEKLTTGTRAHANEFNKIFDKLFENDKFLKYAADSLAEKMLEKGMIIDNFTSERGDLPGSAANDKRLYDMLTEQNNNIQQFDLETKKQYLFDNLSEELKTWSSDNVLPNQTSYKFIAMQRSGADPYLGGGNITIEGHKSDNNHEWQKATTYYSGTKFIKFRDKLLGKWSDWEKIVFNSDLYALHTPIEGTVITNKVPSKVDTIVNSLTLDAGIYIIMANAWYDSAFGGYLTNYFLLQDGNYLVTCRNTGDAGSGQCLSWIIKSRSETTVDFKLYQGSDETRTLSKNVLIATRLA